ncbi:hypothetical protein EVB32_303 [Rhizobium phage RHph_TM39]|uniref:Uncharacterized protein n=1 Tax=Rhizobium phage RHph_TM30 TaxID=2509764 RepID=A0A7S5RB59_9CAUD|nr:hypothetical protein PQC16_gp338 [Rhizobium phage RHph_TM30]QIG71774.1 hypothetical protein EVB94_323 [Rhizobium phage RHph_TM40]QIG72135.1 hypothetical protein EVB95_321 [Rhizobium phage RHph_TM2_3B]QIG72497.1 hypothetical protein EVB96_321 [Rhizobium phage RHph_TM3_3_6]QIG77271.1 hypothetical protein EVB32_303 [Rhizobium phage RHph_TM39]QIG77887.1 hypothetical protein EVB64_321 [Rhizobium phage RHph_TM61]
MSRAKSLIDMIKGTKNESGDDDDEISNRRRGGTWIDPHHVDAASKNLKRTQSFYKKASNASSVEDQEYWLARVFNKNAVAKRISSGFYNKEAKAGVVGVDDVEDLSASLVTGNPRASGRVTTKDHTRNPEEIFAANQIVKALYDTIDKKWPGRPQNKMVLTYFLKVNKADHLINFKLPYDDRVEEIISSIEKYAKDNNSKITWTTPKQFQNFSGIEDRMYAKVMQFLADNAVELGALIIRGKK